MAHRDEFGGRAGKTVREPTAAEKKQAADRIHSELTGEVIETPPTDKGTDALMRVASETPTEMVRDSEEDGTFLFDEPTPLADLQRRGFQTEKCVPMPRGKAIEGTYRGPGPLRTINGVRDPVKTWTIEKGGILLHIHNAHGLEEFFTSKGPKTPREGDLVYIYRALNDTVIRDARGDKEVSNFTCLVLRAK